MNKVDKPLARLTERKRSAQKLKLRIKEEILQLVPQKQRIIREYCKQLYANKLDNVEEMDINS